MLSRMSAAILALLLAVTLMAFVSGGGGDVACLGAVLFFLVVLLAPGRPTSRPEPAAVPAVPSFRSPRAPPSLRSL